MMRRAVTSAIAALLTIATASIASAQSSGYYSPITRSRSGAQLIMGMSDVPYKPVGCHDPKNRSSDPLFQSLPPFNDNGPVWLPLSDSKRADLMHQRNEWAKGTDAVSVCYVAGITQLLEAR